MYWTQKYDQGVCLDEDYLIHCYDERCKNNNNSSKFK